MRPTTFFLAQSIIWVPKISDGPIDYQARQHEIDFVLTPYTGSPNLSFTNAQKTLKLSYRNTTLMFERNSKKTSGLDSTAVRAAQPGSQTNPLLDPQMPIVSDADDRLVLDVEGLVTNQDGTCVYFIKLQRLHGFEIKSRYSFWISDEYGPYIYRFSQTGQLIQTIQPVNAVLPKDSSGALDFTSESDPATGRATNQGNFFIILTSSKLNISTMKRIRRSHNRREYPNPVCDASIFHDSRRWRRLALHAALRIRRLEPRCRPPLGWRMGRSTPTERQRKG